VSPRFWLTFLAPAALASLLLIPKKEETSSTDTPLHLTPLNRYRVGHDWVETPPTPTSKARDFLKGSIEKDFEQCQDKNCQTCQWTQLFGGEW
jgi:hypothetical protein